MTASKNFFLLNGGSPLTLKHQSLSNIGKFESVLS